jgi:hypothetical protein
MDRPTWYPFRDAAMRADVGDWRAEPDAHPGAPGERRDRIVSDRGVVAHAEPPVERRRFSLGATFLGWCVAAFFTLVGAALLAIVLGALGYNEAATDGLGTGDIQSLGIANLVGYLVVAFLAYLIGGYAAGRIALWDGVRHGMLTVAWAALFAILAVAGATYLADTFNVGAYVPSGIDLGNLGLYGILAIVLSLAAMLGGAALGGKMGERYHDRVHGVHRPRATSRTRGRPL